MFEKAHTPKFVIKKKINAENKLSKSNFLKFKFLLIFVHKNIINNNEK